MLISLAFAIIHYSVRRNQNKLSLSQLGAMRLVGYPSSHMCQPALPKERITTRVFETQPGREISHARAVLSPTCFILLISNEEKILSNVNMVV